MKLNKFPKWVSSAICYQIFPDRFAVEGELSQSLNLQKWGEQPTRENFFGGNIKGIISKLDYIKDLGCNTIYFCPIFTSTANHRYHTHDYFQIDPLLGTMDDFENLVKEIHHRNMKIVLDAVLNHASRGLYQFNSLLEVGESSPYKDWFHVKKWPLKAYQKGEAHYECWWGLKDLPKFNTNNQDVREFLWSVGEYWINKNIDGWRLDVPNEIDDDDFWREFRKRVKAINSEAWIVGEIWDEPSRWLQGDQFDGVMNYRLRRTLLDRFFPQENEMKISNQQFVDSLNDLLNHKLKYWMMNLIGSHDTRRITTLANNNQSKLKQIWTLLMHMPGAPCIYYGDEVGLKGGKDPDNRRCFDWDEKNWNHDFNSYIKNLIKIRKENSVLSLGEFKSSIVKGALGLEVILVEMFDVDTKIQLYLNLGSHEETIQIESYQKEMISHKADIYLNDSKITLNLKSNSLWSCIV